MASTHKSLRSSTASKRPTTSIADGQIALNTNAASPGLFFKDSTGADIIKVGPVHVGTTAPNATPAAGGSSGNSTGEVWLDTSLTPVGVKIWDGSAWQNATPAGSTTVQGLLELATNGETQTGTDTARAVTPAGLQSKLSDSTSTTSSTTIASSTAVKSAYDLANAALPKSGGVITGNLEIGATGSLTFEGATDNAFETALAVVDPTADRTITFPDRTGTVITNADTGTVTSTMIADGTIVNADVNASAAIAGTKISPNFGSQTVQTTGVISHALGTAGAPTITFTGDTNTGVYSPGADQVAISTGGTGRLFVDANGDFGIGNSSPSNYRLNLLARSGYEDVAIFSSSGTNIDSRINIAPTGTGLGVINATANALEIQVAGTERLRITSDGKLGLGTSAPPSIFSIEGTDPLITFRNSATNRWQLGYENTNSHRFVLYDTNAAAYRAVIDSSGNVGIGTSSPAFGVGSGLEIERAGSATLRIEDSASGSGFEIQNASSSVTFNGYNNQPFIFKHNASERVRIDSSGRVGIGTTSPDQALSVQGLISTKAPNGATRGLIGSPSWDTSYFAVQNGILAQSAANAALHQNTAGVTTLNSASGQPVLFTVGQGERARIDSSGRLLVGTSTNATTALLQVRGDSAAATNPGTLYLFPNYAPASLGTGDVLGRLQAGANDGSVGATIDFVGDAAWGSGDYPTRLVFSTTPDGSSSPTPRMTIKNDGKVGIGDTGPDATLVTKGAGISDVAFAIKHAWGASTTALMTASNSSGEVMRLQRDGKLLVGTSSARAVGQNSATPPLQIETASNVAAVQIVANPDSAASPTLFFGKSRGGSLGSNTIVQSDDVLGAIAFCGADGNDLDSYGADIKAQVDGTPGANDMPGRLVFSTTADGASVPTERMRLDSLGQNQVFTADVSGAACFSAHHEGGSGSTRLLFSGRYSATGTGSGTQSFRVESSGDVKNTNNSYGAISDLKLKENIVDATSQWDDLKALQVRNYNFKEGQTHTQIGLIAQEVELVSPGLVSEFPDLDEEGNDLGTVTKSVNYSVLYMKAVKALQEAMERIEVLEAKVTALEGN